MGSRTKTRDAAGGPGPQASRALNAPQPEPASLPSHSGTPSISCGKNTYLLRSREARRLWVTQETSAPSPSVSGGEGSGSRGGSHLTDIS